MKITGTAIGGNPHQHSFWTGTDLCQICITGGAGEPGTVGGARTVGDAGRTGRAGHAGEAGGFRVVVGAGSAVGARGVWQREGGVDS